MIEVRSGGTSSRQISRPNPSIWVPPRSDGTFSLDSDIVTQLLKKHSGNLRVVERFRDAIWRNSLFVICPVVFYEIRRELVFKGAVAQLSAFQKLMEAMAWREFSAPVWERASNLWSALRRQGRSHHDADVLIAAHAMEYGAVVVTGNVEHFQDTGVQVENWNAQPR